MSFSDIRSQARLWFLILCLAITGATLANSLMPLAFSARTTASGYHTARLIPNTDVNPYGANLFLDREVEEWKLRKTLQMAQEAGLGWVKQQFPWEEIEPVQKGEFYDERARRGSWEKYDRIVDLCEEYGLQIVARLDRPPDWTREDNTYKGADILTESMRRLGLENTFMAVPYDATPPGYRQTTYVTPANTRNELGIELDETMQSTAEEIGFSYDLAG